MNRKMILTVSALLFAGSALSGCYDDRPGYYHPYHRHDGYDHGPGYGGPGGPGYNDHDRHDYRGY